MIGDVEKGLGFAGVFLGEIRRATQRGAEEEHGVRDRPHLRAIFGGWPVGAILERTDQVVRIENQLQGTTPVDRVVSVLARPGRRTEEEVEVELPHLRRAGAGEVPLDDRGVLRVLSENVSPA